MKNTIYFFALLFASFACQQANDGTQDSVNAERAKYEPEDGKVLLFAGQELEAVGGLENYSDGYLDHYPRPAGFTTYTGFSPGDSSFGFLMKGMDGVWSTDNWGDNDYNVSLQLVNSNYDNMALAIGLWMVNHEQEVAQGELDELINKLSDFLKDIAPRPVFLRIGYEFGGSWNHYENEAYKKAYRRIKDILDKQGVTNVAYVWQSHGYGMSIEELESFYPGDEYVDWCGFSFFNYWKEQKMIEFARAKGKPVFIAEASPTITDTTQNVLGLTKETILSNPEQAQEAWDEWFVPFFQTIEDNPDVVKAISYINCYWKSHPMWKGNPTFKNVDARLQTSELIDKKWREKISNERYVHSSDTLYDELGK